MYAAIHLSHHRYSGNSKEDPETQFYAAQGHDYTGMGKLKLFKILLSDISGVSAIKSAVYGQDALMN